MKKKILFSISAVIFSFLIQNNFPIHAVGASGLSSQLVGVKALGQANAFVAQADDPSANFFNPAGQTQLEGWQTTLGGTIVDINTKYSGQGIGAAMESSPAVLPNFFLTGLVSANNNEKWSLGFGMTTPFGLTTEWSKTGYQRYVTTKSSLETIQYNPSVAYAPNKKISFGLGVDYLSVHSVSLGSQIDQSEVGGADGSQELTGSGGEWGYNAGVLWKPVEKHSFGVSYRSQINVEINGDVSLSGLDPAVQGYYGFDSSSYKSSVQTDMKFPQSLLLGYYFVPNERWTLLLDYEWTDWSVYKQTQLDFSETDSTRLEFLNTDNPTPKNWKDVHAFAIGSQYNFKNGIKFRSGYSYFTTAVPGSTWEPGVPDSNQHTIATGLGYSWGDLTLDLAYNYILYDNRNINNDVGDGAINGQYKTHVDVFGLGFTYKFIKSK